MSLLLMLPDEDNLLRMKKYLHILAILGLFLSSCINNISDFIVIKSVKYDDCGLHKYTYTIKSDSYETFFHSNVIYQIGDTLK